MVAEQVKLEILALFQLAIETRTLMFGVAGIRTRHRTRRSCSTFFSAGVQLSTGYVAFKLLHVSHALRVTLLSSFLINIEPAGSLGCP